MRDLKIKVNKKGAIDIGELAKTLEETKDEALSLVRNTYPYKIPKGYMSWRLLSSIISMGIVGIEHKRLLFSQDRASFLHAHKCTLWFVQNAPIYCLKESILEPLLKTDVLNSKQILKDLKPQISSFILLFPSGSIMSSENAPVEFCIVHLSDRLHPENSQGSAHGVVVPHLSHEHDINLHWSTVDSDGTVWFSGMGLYPDGRLESNNESVGLNAIKSKDAEFLNKMRSLVLQCFLLMQYEPETISNVVSEEIQQKARPKGFAAPLNETKSLYPRWLSEPKSRRSSPSIDLGGTHASPSAHWRRGHWREAAVGVGRNEKRWTWVRPAFVNPG